MSKSQLLPGIDKRSVYRINVNCTRSVQLHYCLVLTLLLLSFTSSGQSGFTRTYGRTGFTMAGSISSTIDQGYILAGTGNNNSGTGWLDLMLVKLNTSYQLEWMKSYGANYIDYGNTAIQTSDGGFLLAGNASDTPSSNGLHVAVIKTDSAGNVQWSKWLASSSNGSTGGYALFEDTTGDFYVTGSADHISSFTGMLIAKLDASGNLLWSKIHRQTSASHSVGLGATRTLDGGFIMTGYGQVLPAGSNVILIKTDANGDVQWAKNYGMLVNSEYGISVMQHADSGYSVAGAGYSSALGVYLLRTDNNGNILWARNYTDSLNGYFIQSCIVTASGEYVMSGYADTYFTGPLKKFACKMDTSGYLMWAKTYDLPNPQYNNELNDIMENGSGYLFAGSDGSDIYLLQTDMNGISGCIQDTVSLQTYLTPTIENTSSTQTTISTFISNYTFNVQDGGIQNSPCVSRTKPDPIGPSITIFPNPITDFATVEFPGFLHNAQLCIYDLAGKLVRHPASLSVNPYTLSRDELSGGIYTICITAAEGTFIGKLAVYPENR